MAASFDPIYDPTYGELMAVIRRVRARWRVKVGLRGLVMLTLAGFAAFAMSVWGMDYFLYSERAVQIFRWLTYVALVALAVRLLVVPLAQRVSKRQVALYVEEHEPTLKASVLSAVELGPVQQGSPRDTERVSPELQRRVLEEAIERCQSSGFATGIERGPLRRFSAALLGVAGAGMAAVLISPAFLQHGAMLLFAPWRAAAADNPYQLRVGPGNLTVARGSDQLITAAVLGFDPDRVEVALRPLDASGNAQGDWQQWPMNRLGVEGEASDELMIGDARVTHDFIALNLRSDTDYYVDASGVRSPIYRIRVKDLPYVEQIDLQYRFPEYSGLSDQTVEDGGDIAVLEGTEVLFSVLPIFAVPEGRLLIEGEEPIGLSPGSGRMTAAFTVSGNTYYRVELMDEDGRWHRASAEYMITALEDQPPIVRFASPGRDIQVTLVDEVFAQVEAEDDYGVSRLGIRYAINGGEETAINLLDSRSSMKKVNAGHTLFLEEMELTIGDSISYYAEAWDRSRSKPVISDIYFLEIRPFDRNYRRAEQGGGGGMGGGGGFDNTLSVQQKMIISATFRLVRDAEEYSAREMSEHVTTVALMQGRLRDQVGSLITRMGNRGQSLLGDEEFSRIIEFLQQASTEMAAAKRELEAERLDDAMTVEKQALASLQRAESAFRDLTVSFQQGGGGGGGGNQQLSEDLADLFELELDKLRNQYETVQRGAAEQTQAEIDELMQKLRELARRQQRENERQNRLRGRQQQGGGGGGGQQQLIDETEELARRLERLAREQQRSELRQTTQALREAVEQMKRSQAGSSGSQSSAGAQGIAALDKLRDARRLLDRDRRQQLGRDMDELEQRAQRVSDMQGRIEEQVEDLAGQEGEDGRRRSDLTAQERSELIERIMERKDRLTDEVAGLEAQLNRMMRSARDEQPEAARKLQASAEVIRDEQLKEKIRYSKGVLAGRDAEFARLFEGQIRRDIDEVMERIAEAQASVGEGGGDRQDRMLEQARDLVENMSSLEARLRDRAEAGARLGQRSGQGGDQQSGDQQGGDQQGGDQQGGNQEGGNQEGGGTDRGGARNLEAGGRDWGRPSQYGSSSGGWYQPGVFTAEDLRQFERELDQRRSDLEALRADLRRERMDTTDLDQLLRQMGDLTLLGLNKDPLALESLRRDVVEGLRQFEYRLWRELRGADTERVYLGNSDQVPPGYRELVDEYFRKLASES